MAVHEKRGFLYTHIIVCLGFVFTGLVCTDCLSAFCAYKKPQICLHRLLIRYLCILKSLNLTAQIAYPLSVHIKNLKSVCTDCLSAFCAY